MNAYSTVVILQLHCASKHMTLTNIHATHCDWSENACSPTCVRLTVLGLRARQYLGLYKILFINNKSYTAILRSVLKAVLQ